MHLAVNGDTLAQWSAEMRTCGAQCAISSLVLSQYDALTAKTPGYQPVLRDLRELYPGFEIEVTVIVQNCSRTTFHDNSCW
jgi:hypothetical protein